MNDVQDQTPRSCVTAATLARGLAKIDPRRRFDYATADLRVGWRCVICNADVPTPAAILSLTANDDPRDTISRHRVDCLWRQAAEAEAAGLLAEAPTPCPAPPVDDLDASLARAIRLLAALNGSADGAGSIVVGHHGAQAPAATAHFVQGHGEWSVGRQGPTLPAALDAFAVDVARQLGERRAQIDAVLQADAADAEAFVAAQRAAPAAAMLPELTADQRECLRRLADVAPNRSVKAMAYARHGISSRVVASLVELGFVQTHRGASGGSFMRITLTGHRVADLIATASKGSTPP